MFFFFILIRDNSVQDCYRPGKSRKSEKVREIEIDHEKAGKVSGKCKKG